MRIDIVLVISVALLNAGCVSSWISPDYSIEMLGDVGALYTPSGAVLALWTNEDGVFVGYREQSLQSAIEDQDVTQVYVPRHVGSTEIAGVSRCALGFSDILEGVYVEDGVALGIATFYYSVRLKSVRLPKDLHEIPDSLFSNCHALEAIEIPSSVVRIGDSAFYRTALKRVIIPDSVETIGSEAFGCCRRLEFVSLPYNAIVDSSAFDGCDKEKLLVERRGIDNGSSVD